MQSIRSSVTMSPMFQMLMFAILSLLMGTWISTPCHGQFVINFIPRTELIVGDTNLAEVMKLFPEFRHLRDTYSPNMTVIQELADTLGDVMKTNAQRYGTIDASIKVMKMNTVNTDDDHKYGDEKNEDEEEEEEEEDDTVVFAPESMTSAKRNEEGNKQDIGVATNHRQLSRDKLLVVFGTWCSTSRKYIGHFAKIIDELSSLNPSLQYALPIELVGIDNHKTQPADIIQTYNITHVPTFLALRSLSSSTSSSASASSSTKYQVMARITEVPWPNMEADLLRLIRILLHE